MSEWDWTESQKKMIAIEPRPLLLKTLELFNGFKGFAVELGCGGGVDTLKLVNSGWKVYAVDSTTVGFDNIKSKISCDKIQNVELKQDSFESISIPDADLVYSSYSIPFCKSYAFDTFWNKITKAVKINGRFAGHLFGEQDGWKNYIKDITLITKPEAYRLLKCFDIEYFDELCEDRLSVNTNEMKRWHIFEIIASKRKAC